jgi:hypothetical protein
MKQTILTIIIGLPIGFVAGSVFQFKHDLARIEQSQANENQANGLEDECKAVLNFRPASAVETQLIEDHDTGDWRFYIYGKRKMVCEEKAIRITNQGDAENPISLECRHAKP